jgi:hypothetical protein
VQNADLPLAAWIARGLMRVCFPAWPAGFRDPQTTPSLDDATLPYRVDADAKPVAD